MDRGYIASPLVDEVLADGGEVICKPWVARNGELFTKAEFKINMREMSITCPAGEVERIDLGADARISSTCAARPPCRTYYRPDARGEDTGRDATAFLARSGLPS